MSEVSRQFLSAAAATLTLLTSCTSTVTGQAARPVNVVERALPTAAELKQVLGVAMGAGTPPQLGGLDTLRDDKDAVSPRDCAGITHTGYRQSYEGASVRDTARKLWTTPYSTDDHISAAISIIELDSAHDAQSWYAKSEKQWHKCQGVTVTERLQKLSFIQTISRVTESNETLTVQIAITMNDKMMSPGVNWRALTATSRYLVDVEVCRIGDDAGSPDPDPSAVARLVAGNIANMR
jgi:hypothetical protein